MMNNHVVDEKVFIAELLVNDVRSMRGGGSISVEQEDTQLRRRCYYTPGHVQLAAVPGRYYLVHEAFIEDLKLTNNLKFVRYDLGSVVREHFSYMDARALGQAAAHQLYVNHLVSSNVVLIELDVSAYHTFDYGDIFIDSLFSQLRTYGFTTEKLKSRLFFKTSDPELYKRFEKSMLGETKVVDTSTTTGDGGNDPHREGITETQS